MEFMTPSIRGKSRRKRNESTINLGFPAMGVLHIQVCHCKEEEGVYAVGPEIEPITFNLSGSCPGSFKWCRHATRHPSSTRDTLGAVCDTPCPLATARFSCLW